MLGNQFLIHFSNISDKSSSEIPAETSPKVYNIGLYKTAETQYEPPSEITNIDNTDNYEVISFSLTVSTENSDTESEHNHATKSDVESSKKDFTTKPENQAVLRQLRDKIEQKCPEKNKNYNIYDKLPQAAPDSKLSVPGYICDIMSHPPDTLKKVIPIIRGTVKQHASLTSNEEVLKTISAPETSFSEEVLFSKSLSKANKWTPSSELGVSEPTKEEGQQNSDSKQASKLRTEQKPVTESDQNNVKDNTLDEDESISFEDYVIVSKDASSEEQDIKKYTVMTVQVHGDSIPLKSHSAQINVLEVAKNGRYKDEEHLFCENGSQEYTCNSPRGRLEDVCLHCQQEQYLQSSNSDTITTKTLSTGEIKCNCSVSSGEVHFHNDDMFFERKLKLLPSSKKKSYAIRKRTYFSNWVTYFVKNDNFVNDSSWSSSNK